MSLQGIDTASIKNAVSQYLAANPIPSGKKAAIFVHTDNGTVQTGIAFKQNDSLNIDVHTSFNVAQPDHNFAVGVNIIKYL